MHDSTSITVYYRGKSNTICMGDGGIEDIFSLLQLYSTPAGSHLSLGKKLTQNSYSSFGCCCYNIGFINRVIIQKNLLFKNGFFFSFIQATQIRFLLQKTFVFFFFLQIWNSNNDQHVCKIDKINHKNDFALFCNNTQTEKKYKPKRREKSTKRKK